jgi:glucose-1-phosphate thymidylyltransferase
MLAASQLIKSLEVRTGLKVGCIEEIAINKGFVSSDKLLEYLKTMKESPYKEYVLNLIK